MEDDYENYPVNGNVSTLVVLLVLVLPLPLLMSFKKKQTGVINITKCKRISGKKKDFNLTSRQAAARATSLFSFIFRLNGGPNG